MHFLIDFSQGAFPQQLFECREVFCDTGQDDVLEGNAGLFHVIIQDILTDDRLRVAILKLMLDLLARINRADGRDFGPDLQDGKIGNNILGAV